MKYTRLFLLLSLLSQSSFALPLSSPPNACPSINAIVKTGLNDAEKGMLGWVASNISQYDTSEKWFFGLFGFLVPEDNKDAAINIGNENIKKLSQFEGPKEDSNNTWTCVYADDESSILGVAFTPPLTHNYAVASFILLRK